VTAYLVDEESLSVEEQTFSDEAMTTMDLEGTTLGRASMRVSYLVTLTPY